MLGFSATDTSGEPGGRGNLTETRDCYLMWINNLILPIFSNGPTPDGSRNCHGVSQMLYLSPSQNVVFAGGFMLSGIANDTMWANAVATAGRIHDYASGRVLSTPQDTAGVFVVDRNDPPFGFSWQEWRKAVRTGADFYDGDSDGVYNPVDLNNNGLWDPNEDAPDLLGDHTAWFVANDGLDPSRRLWNTVTPKGIDVQISLFGYRTPHQPLGNIIFLRYRLVNRGTTAQIMDSVFFSPWADADIGEYGDDLIGADTLLQASYAWNDSTDGIFGVEAPAFMMVLLEGPVAYIPGVTFIDLNSNGLYDPGEPALDTARTFHGPVLGVRIYPGATNLGMTSSGGYPRSDPLRGDPNTYPQARNYMRGLLKNGTPLDPCTDPYGTVYGQPCSEVNNRYWYSGDPVTNLGWIYRSRTDMRTMHNTGPFKLHHNQAIDVVVAYLVGRGTDARNSVAVARNIASYAHTVYEQNFPIITSTRDYPLIPKEFSLEQNYPNPFNPTTTIQFSIPKRSTTVLKVFDVLGREIATLLNEPKQPGIHTVHWDASAFPSGIYFYRLQTNDFVKTKKMILVK